MLRPLSSRGRVVLAAAIATLPFLGLVAYRLTTATTPTADAPRREPRRGPRSTRRCSASARAVRSPRPRSLGLHASGRCWREALSRCSTPAVGSSGRPGVKKALLGLRGSARRSGARRYVADVRHDRAGRHDADLGVRRGEGKAADRRRVAMPGAPFYGPAEDALRRDVLFALWAAAVALVPVLPRQPGDRADPAARGARQ